MIGKKKCTNCVKGYCSPGGLKNQSTLAKGQTVWFCCPNHDRISVLVGKGTEIVKYCTKCGEVAWLSTKSSTDPEYIAQACGCTMLSSQLLHRCGICGGTERVPGCSHTRDSAHYFCKHNKYEKHE